MDLSKTNSPLLRNRLYLTAGTKVEHNYYTGFGVMPSTPRRMAVQSAHQTVWAAVSRALRTPAALDVSEPQVTMRDS